MTFPEFLFAHVL